MHFSEYVEFVEPERKKPTLFFRIWYRFKTIRDTINHDKKWEFEGSTNTDGTPLKWSFKEGYQLLLYYRVK
jgi:hypothetical protein